MAYQLKKEYNLPYIVAVRNSDVNVFFKYFINLRKLGVEILKNAEKVIFISPAYLKNTIDKYVPVNYREEIRKKSLVVPNGLNQYWIENRVNKSKVLNSNKIKLVYIGEITKNKNIHKVINDVENMNNNGMDVTYTIVGDGEYLNQIKSIFEKIKNKSKIRILGRINDKDKLKEILDDNDIFVMNSSFETFGLSYIEALSRGLPVIYTKDQGVYGYFKEGYIGYGVERGTSINEAVNKIIDNYDSISKNAIKVIDEFRWTSIGDKYIDIYGRLLENKE
nr:glycosyltransferase family 4 protein [Clostridium gallinarum]